MSGAGLIALRDYRVDLAEAQRWPENVRQRRIDELEEQIRWIESGEYRRAPPNNFSARVEEAFPDLYANRTAPNAGSDRNALQRALRERMERE